MTHRQTCIGLFSLACLLAAGNAHATGYFNQPAGPQSWKEGKQNQRAQESYQGRGQEHRRISGTVQRTKTVGLQGRDEENFIVKLETQDGRSKIVDLGNAENIEDLDIQRGDRITVWGRTTHIGDQRIFLADKVRVNDETVTIDRRYSARYDENVNQMGRDRQTAKEEGFFEGWFD